MKLPLTILLLALLATPALADDPPEYEWKAEIFFKKRQDTPPIEGVLHTCVNGNNPGEAFDEARMFAAKELPKYYYAYKIRIRNGCDMQKE
jgi:hypothetical protein